MNSSQPIPSLEALARLREGNQRFAANLRSIESLLSQLHRAELASGQAPFAVILGCSDSRAPAELVFDQGLGDLFVIRVAGNVVAPSQVASVEFAADAFRSSLVVVMGHTHCGAIGATISAVLDGGTSRASHIGSIVDRIRPSVETLARTPLAADRAALAAEAVRANIRAAADHLRHGSPLLEELIGRGELLVVGAEYDLDSGAVDFFDGVPG